MNDKTYDSSSNASPVECDNIHTTPIARSLRDNVVCVAQRNYKQPYLTNNQNNRFAYIEDAYNIYSQEYGNTCPVNGSNQCLDIAGFTIWLHKRYNEYLEYKGIASGRNTEATCNELHNNYGLICNSPCHHYGGESKKKANKFHRFRSSTCGPQRKCVATYLETEFECRPQMTQHPPKQDIGNECYNIVPKVSYDIVKPDKELVGSGLPRGPVQNRPSSKIYKNKFHNNNVLCECVPTEGASSQIKPTESAYSKLPLDRNVGVPTCLSVENQRITCEGITCLMQPPTSPERNWIFSSDGEERKHPRVSPKVSKSRMAKQKTKHLPQKRSLPAVYSVTLIKSTTNCECPNPPVVSNLPYGTNGSTKPPPMYLYSEPQTISNNSAAPPKECEAQTSDHSITLSANPNQPQYFLKVVFADEIKKWRASLSDSTA